MNGKSDAEAWQTAAEHLKLESRKLLAENLTPEERKNWKFIQNMIVPALNRKARKLREQQP